MAETDIKEAAPRERPTRTRLRESLQRAEKLGWDKERKAEKTVLPETREALIGRTRGVEGMKPTLTPQNIRPEQVGRIAGRLYNEGIKAQGGAEKFRKLVASAEETEKASQARSRALTENIAARYRQKQAEKEASQFKVPEEAKGYIPPSQRPAAPRPFTPAPEQAIREQIQQTPEPRPRGLFSFLRKILGGK